VVIFNKKNRNYILNTVKRRRQNFYQNLALYPLGSNSHGRWPAWPQRTR
jgi:hypothetical protein